MPVVEASRFSRPRFGVLIGFAALLVQSVPDLIDHSAGSAIREVVDRVLSSNAGEFEHLDRVRSRRSGRVVFIEIVLSFEAGLTILEVNRRIEALRQTMQQEIEHADISILTTMDAGLNLLGGDTGAAKVLVP